MDDSIQKRLRTHAQDRLRFEPGADPSLVVAAYKKFLSLENQMILRNHRRGESGRRVAQIRSIAIDVLFENLYHFAIVRRSSNPSPLRS